MTSEKEAAAAAALEQGREMATFEIVDRPMVVNGRRRKPGSRIRLSRADGAVFVEFGRVKPAKGKPSPPDDDQDESAEQPPNT